MKNYVVKGKRTGEVLGNVKADYYRQFSNMVKFFNDSGTSAFPDEQVDIVWVDEEYLVEEAC